MLMNHIDVVVLGIRSYKERKEKEEMGSVIYGSEKCICTLKGERALR